MMARTLDKARALLPGGNPGRYYITPGLSAWLLGKLGLSEEQFSAIVAQAQCEDDVVARFDTLLPEEKREKINRFITRFTLNDVPEEMQRHILAAHPWGFDESLPVIEVIEEDDRRSFPSSWH